MPNSIDYLTVYNAHSGSSAKIPKPVRFSTFQKFKNYLRESFTNDIMCSTDNVFLLTPFGIKLDFAVVNEMTELYLYDRRAFQKSTENTLIAQYLDQATTSTISSLKPHPFLLFETSTDKNSPPNIKELLESLKKYSEWVEQTASNLRHICDRIDKLIRQINVIFKALNIIFLFASNFVGSTEKAFKTQYNHVNLLAMKSLKESWKSHASILEEFPPFRLKDGNNIKISDYLDYEVMSKAAKYVSENIPGIITQFNEMSRTVNQVNDDKMKVDKFIEMHRHDSMVKFEDFQARRLSLNAEIESLMVGIFADILALDTAPTEELEKYYAKHFSVSKKLFGKVMEVYQFSQSFDSFLTNLAQDCPEVYENIAIQQMKCVEVKAKLKKLISSEKENQITEANVISKIKEKEGLLSTTIDLPLLLGIVLIEKRRQFEWHDFYSKGIVANISEQLASLIEDEKVFQRLWMKKFGLLIKLLSPETAMDVHVPSIDVTLVNSGLSMADDSVLHWIRSCRVERDDILKYIEGVRNHRFVNNERFAALLEKNFKGLVVSTEKLKNVTKTVVSLGSQFLLSGLGLLLQVSVRNNGKGADEDADIMAIKGLKSRINKLEDLLHQQQFKNLTGWPVVKSNDTRVLDTKASLLLTRLRGELASKSPISLLPKVSAPKTPSLKPAVHQSNRKILDASTTIDKHLDNIRLRKEISELRTNNIDLARQNNLLLSDLEDCNKERNSLRKEKDILLSNIGDFKKEIDALRNENELIRQNQEENRSELGKAKVCHEEEMASLKKEYNITINQLQTEERELKKLLKLKSDHVSALELEIDALGKLLQEAHGSKNDCEAKLVLEIDELRKTLENIDFHEPKLEKDILDLTEQIKPAQEEEGPQESEHSCKISEVGMQLKTEGLSTYQDNEVLRDEISMLTAKLGDVLVMNAELLSNMQAKQSEFSIERSEVDKTIRHLENRLEEKTDDFEHLMEMTQGKQREMEKLLTATNKSLRALLNSLADVMMSHVKYFHDFCMILESMGLLLVQETNDESKYPEFRIRRVKGLRSKKEIDDSKPHLERSKSTAVQELSRKFDWITEFANQHRQIQALDEIALSSEESTHDSDVLEVETRLLLQVCEKYVLSTGGVDSKLSEFLNTIPFEKNVQLQAHEDGRGIFVDRFFPNGIVKRFNDVEGFAKKLTRENKAKVAELAKVTRQASEKISVKNFQAGDLVLFLPTRIERSEITEDAATLTPWTAFNIDAPHYFLDIKKKAASFSSEEWLVSRIASIVEHTVTEANARDMVVNPFSLSVGITWHMVDIE